MLDCLVPFCQPSKSPPLRLIDSERPGDAQTELNFEAALFQNAEADGPREILRFWECPRPAVVLGRAGVIARDVHEEACLADGAPVLRRISGGGAVVVGPGCLNYTLLLSLELRPELRLVSESYRRILDRVLHALALRGLTVSGMSDLAIHGRKISGNAQRRGRRTLLHHGTILYDFDAALMNRYLKRPEREPDYRAGRPHETFVTNAPLGPYALKKALARAWDAAPERDEKADEVLSC